MLKITTALILAIIFLSGCALPRALPEAGSLNVSDDEVVVIGKFQLDPPINTNIEQKTHWNIIGDGAIINHIAMATGEEFKPVDMNHVRSKEWKSYIKAKWDNTFIVKAKRHRTYLNGAMMQLDMMSADRLWFPGGFYFDAPKDAKAIYIGTLRYDRNEFNTIKNVRVIDEYNSTIKSIKNQFGSAAKIHKSLLQPINK